MNSSSRYLNLHRPSYSIDLNQGQQQQQLYDHQILHHHHSFSGLESHSPPTYSNPVQDDQLGSYLYMGSQIHPSPYHEQEFGGSYGSGSHDQTTLETKEAKRTKLKFTICKNEEQSSGGGDEINGGSTVKWMPLRIMKNLMRGDEDQKHQAEDETCHLMRKTLMGDSSNISGGGGNNTAIRVCSDCNTTKTPLWRSGPRGPKSLCNACGIRQRKARRAMAMAANGSTPPSVMKAGNGHKKTANNNTFGGQKKRSKVVKASPDNHHYNVQRKLCFEEFALKLSKKLSVQQVFPQEEKEAAILLMALSCGFVQG
ncbi:hypothetical protein V2J09_003247 [Rumex salicifolius]